MTDGWDAALVAAAAAWPELPALTADAFAAHARALRATGGALAAHLADLYLAFAAGRGIPAAVTRLAARIAPAIAPAIRRIDGSPAFLDEVCQVVRVRLLVGAAEPPRIAAYRATGPLDAWLRVTAVRAALNIKRGDRPAVSIDDVLEPVVAGGAAIPSCAT